MSHDLSSAFVTTDSQCDDMMSFDLNAQIGAWSALDEGYAEIDLNGPALKLSGFEHFPVTYG